MGGGGVRGVWSVRGLFVWGLGLWAGFGVWVFGNLNTNHAIWCLRLLLCFPAQKKWLYMIHARIDNAPVTFRMSYCNFSKNYSKKQCNIKEKRIQCRGNLRKSHRPQRQSIASRTSRGLNPPKPCRSARSNVTPVCIELTQMIFTHCYW